MQTVEEVGGLVDQTGLKHTGGVALAEEHGVVLHVVGNIAVERSVECDTNRLNLSNIIFADAGELRTDVTFGSIYAAHVVQPGASGHLIAVNLLVDGRLGGHIDGVVVRTEQADGVVALIEDLVILITVIECAVPCAGIAGFNVLEEIGELFLQHAVGRLRCGKQHLSHRQSGTVGLNRRGGAGHAAVELVLIAAGIACGLNRRTSAPVHLDGGAGLSFIKGIRRLQRIGLCREVVHGADAVLDDVAEHLVGNAAVPGAVVGGGSEGLVAGHPGILGTRSHDTGIVHAIAIGLNPGQILALGVVVEAEEDGTRFACRTAGAADTGGIDHLSHRLVVGAEEHILGAVEAAQVRSITGGSTGNILILLDEVVEDGEALVATLVQILLLVEQHGGSHVLIGRRHDVH